MDRTDRANIAVVGTLLVLGLLGLRSMLPEDRIKPGSPVGELITCGTYPSLQPAAASRPHSAAR
jgi:hypothetical protein